VKTAELDYELPERCIAHAPLALRDASRLLRLDRRSGTVTHHRFGDLPDLLEPGDAVVRNDSRVLPARLLARRATGGQVNLLLLERSAPDSFRALARPASRLRSGEILRLPGGEEVVVTGAAGPDGVITITAPGIEATVERVGMAPLPPYIRRGPTPEDRERYQTVYARDSGSVAAPTAGLHFTPRVLERLGTRGMRILDVTLHIGRSTFLPLRAETLAEHRMHAEAYAVPQETVAGIRRSRDAGGRVIAVGTSSLRALESAAAGGELRAARGHTELFVTPGFSFAVVDGLVTNFHQPRSTLLALVAAFAGLENVLAAYREATRNGYRFLSYGDAMVIL
jgi:S-adenosylmethionine:tRNA ribosyltransferase-isomerase